MGYSEYKTIRKLHEKLGIREIQIPQLFQGVVDVPPSAWLLESIRMAYTMPFRNEKERSERLVSPILTEVIAKYNNTCAMYSGTDLYVNSDLDLNGPCDFFLTMSEPSTELTTPIVTFVEAKDQDMEYGRAQCGAQMYAAHIFNKQAGNGVDIIYGCACTGEMWQFLKLENNILYTEIQSMFLPQIAGILGKFHHIIASYGRL